MRDAALAQDHPTPHGLKGKVLAWSMQHDAGIRHLTRACELAPGFAYPFYHRAEAAMWAGRPADAPADIERAMALDASEFGFFLTIRGLALWMQGELPAAHAALARAVTRSPGYAWPHGWLVAHAERGDLEAARDAAVLARQANRRFSLPFAQAVVPFACGEHRHRLLQAWRAAGMPKDEAAGGAVTGAPAFGPQGGAHS